MLLTAGIFLTALGLLFYFGIHNLLRSFRNVGHAVDVEVVRRRHLNPSQLRDAEEVRSAASPKPQAASPASDSPAAQLLSFMQERAKTSDDAHKARILMHVDRAVPPISDDGRETIERGRAARLAIKHIFPPRLPQRSMSYFGGLPIIPDNFDWPLLHNCKRLLERLNFMAQIDCSDLPPGPGRDLLPDKGYLYFFAPMSHSFGPDAMHFVTRYEPRPATKRWSPLGAALTSKIEPADAMEKIWRGKRTHYDRVEIEFGWIEEPSDDEVAARAADGHAFEVADKICSEKSDAFYGSPASPDLLLSAHHAPKVAPWTPYAGFPANWKTARIIRMLVEAYQREEAADVMDRLKALGDVADDNPEGERLRTLLRDLAAFSDRMFTPFFPTLNAGLKEYDAPPDEVKQQIMTFLEDLRVNRMPSSKERHYAHLQLPLVINDWLAIAAIHGAEGGLTDPAGAEQIPPDVVAALAHRHTARKHQMLGEGEVVQVAADEMNDRYLLLLQLGPDAALNWMGSLQYWITPEDLAAKRFENTVLTIEAY